MATGTYRPHSHIPGYIIIYMYVFSPAAIELPTAVCASDSTELCKTLWLPKPSQQLAKQLQFWDACMPHKDKLNYMYCLYIYLSI